jgi:tetratricopeptide (TPR) repeat protein
MTSPNRSDHIRDLFDELVGLAPEERTAHLAEACGDDEDLRRDVESLLEAEDARGSGVRRALEGLQPSEEADGKSAAPSGPGRIPAALQAALADRYSLVREIGRGGMATVYLADDLKHPRQVAIKVMDPDLSEALGADRFLGEIETASSLTHPHILPLHDSGEAEGLLYYVMPFVEGESLRHRLKREKQLPVEDAVHIAGEIAGALQYAHDRGVIHRDVKPANILLEAGHAVLADFGIAKAVSEVDRTGLTQRGASLGTPTYMSPEQTSGEQKLDGRSDQYALGCVLYEMLTGQPPHQGPNLAAIVAKMMAGPAQSVRTLRSDVPEAVARALAVALERKPEDRHATVAEFGAALAGGAAPKPNRRWSVWAATAAMAAVIPVAWYVGASRSGASGASDGDGLNPNLVAVLPVTVQGSAELEYLEAGMADLLAMALDGAGELATADSWAILGLVEREAPPGPLDPEIARDIAARFGAGRFVLARLLEAGGRIRVMASLYDAKGEPETRADWEVEDEEQIPELVDEVARQLLAKSAGQAGDQLTGIGAVTTQSLDALKAYLRGEELFRLGVADPDMALAAVAADTTFALAYFRMSFLNILTSVNLGVAPRDAAERARRFSDRLPPGEQRLLECYYANLVRRDEREAERLCRELTELEPHNADAWYMLGGTRKELGLRRGRPIADARDAFDQALELEPTYMRYQLLLQRNWLADIEEDFVGAVEYLQRAVEMHPQASESRNYRLVLDAFHGDESALDRLVFRGWGDTYLWATRTWKREDREATVEILRGTTAPHLTSNQRAQGHLMIAQEELAAGRLTAAREELAEAQSLDPDASMISRAYLLLSPYLEVTTGDLSVVRDEVAGWSPAAPADRVWRLYLLGLLDERMGDPAGAERYASDLQAYATGLNTEDVASATALAEDLALYLRARLACRAEQYEEAWTLLQQTEPQRWWPTLDWRSHRLQLYERWLTAEVLVARDRREDALHWLAGFGMPGERSYMGIRHFRMGEIYEELGNAEKAAHHYGRFVTYWRDADPELQWRVQEARQRIEALSVER